jgi:hypothetical protein
VEVPIIVIDAASETVITAERLVEDTIIAEGKANPDGRFVLRVFDVDYHAVEGQLALVAYRDNAGEGWSDCWPTDRDLTGERLDQLPPLASSFTALHGMRYGGAPAKLRAGNYSRQWIQRCDLRAAFLDIPLSRSESANSTPGEVGNVPATLATDAIEETARIAVDSHLRQSERALKAAGVYYTGEVLSAAPLPRHWQSNYPGTVVTWQDGNRVDISFSELLTKEEIAIATWRVPSRYADIPPAKCHPREISSPAPIVSLADIPKFAQGEFQDRWTAMNLVRVDIQQDLWLLTFSTQSSPTSLFEKVPDSNAWIGASFSDSFSALQYRLTPNDFVLLNRSDPIVNWLIRLRDAAAVDSSVVDQKYAIAAWQTASKKPWDMRTLIALWDENPNVPLDLRPPRKEDGQLIRHDYRDLIGRYTVA